MDEATILMLTKAVFDVIARHAHKVTPEEAAAEISKELSDGNSIIAKWFASKGLTPPK